LNGKRGKNSNIMNALSSTSGWSSSPSPGSPGNDTLSNNSSGFSALPGGNCNLFEGFYPANEYGYWWFSTESEENENQAWSLLLGYSNPDIIRITYSKEAGFSVRCIKN